MFYEFSLKPVVAQLYADYKADGCKLLQATRLTPCDADYCIFQVAQFVVQCLLLLLCELLLLAA